MFIIITRVLLIASAYLLVCALGYLGFLTFHHNIIGWFLILTALSYALGGPYLIWSHIKKEGVVRREKQDLSFWLLLPGFITVFYASPLEYLYLSAIVPRNGSFQLAGVILIGISLLLFIWARLSLKALYSGRLQVTIGHTIVQHGPYHLIRHPAYLAYIMMCLGIAIGFSSLISLVAIPLLLLPGLLYRIHTEEKILTTEFGDEYIRYARRTWRLVPGLW